MRRSSVLGWAVLLATALAGVSKGQGTGGEAEEFFELKVRPVLAGTCFPCHGGKKTSGGLRVDSRQALLEGGDSGPAIEPGNPEGSLLVAAVRHEDEALKMPPGAGAKLPDEAVADLVAWVARGAEWPESAAGFRAERHWAFEPVRTIQPPDDPTGWSGHPIDRFLSARWRAAGLTPVGEVDRRALIRRLSFDLIGLPPTPEEVAGFTSDPAPDAYERLVDRLLASPRYGERWGRHWMDVARYADTAGDNADYPIPEVRLYRDYLIDAFNADKPYDELVREQVAGDLLAPGGPPERYGERIVATGFLALSRRYATAPYELWHLSLEDAIETTGRAFLGLTLRCARCHDHKFDLVTQEDYYALYGIFASTRFPYAGSEELASMAKNREGFQGLLPPAQALPRFQAHAGRMAALATTIQKAEREDPLVAQAAPLGPQIAAIEEALRPLAGAGQDSPPLKAQLARLLARRDEANGRLASKLDPLRKELKALARLGLPPDLPGAYAVSEGAPHDEPLQQKGDPAKPGPVVPRGFIQALDVDSPPPIPPGSSGRLQLAEWLTRPDHPLTARVMVNRVWQHHFGRGLVATPSNFGLRGEPPSHPELLDWLASRFVSEGWSIKAMHRLIVTSRAYRLSSDLDSADAAIDPADRLLWRYPRRRLDAEAIRDAMLAASGRLDPNRPGPHPFPPVDQWGWTQHNPFKAVYPSDRRSVYLMTQRLQRHPFLGLFDGPDTNNSTDVRARSTVPLQALYLMNDPFVRDQAEGLARRLLDGPAAPEARIARAHELAWGRPPSGDESARALAYLDRYRAGLREAGCPDDRVEVEAWTSFARVMLTANEFLYVE
jgi:cytochrome c553